MPCAVPDGPIPALSGREAALASLSARQAKERGLLTSGTCGPHSTISSASVALSRSLASRLQAVTALHVEFDLVQADMEAAGYACGAVDTCAAGFGAPHIRQRLYWVADADGKQRHRGRFPEAGGGLEFADGGTVCRLADADIERSQGRSRMLKCSDKLLAGQGGLVGGEDSNSLACFWRDADWLLCRDGRWRPVEPGTFPLVDGASARVGRLRGYGNAIVAPQAEAFIKAFLNH